MILGNRTSAWLLAAACVAACAGSDPPSIAKKPDGQAGTVGAAGDGAGGEAGASGQHVCRPDDEDEITISSAADVLVLAARQCDVWDGTLHISSATLENLDALLPGTLRTITGSLLVYDNPKLTSLSGLSGLERIEGSLFVTQNAALAGLEGLESVQQIGSDSTTDSLVVINNDALVSLGALETAVELDVSLSISGNDQLTRLDGLSGLKRAATVTVVTSPALETLDGLGGLESCDTCNFGSNPVLQRLDLPALVETKSITITDHAELEGISLPALARVEQNLTIAANGALTSLGNLDALERVDQLVITFNQRLPQCFVDALDERLMACHDSCSGNDADAACE